MERTFQAHIVSMDFQILEASGSVKLIEVKAVDMLEAAGIIDLKLEDSERCIFISETD